MRPIRLSDAFRGLLAALAADLAFIMAQAFALRAITGYPAAAQENSPLINFSFPFLIAAGMPAGILFGLFKLRVGGCNWSKRQVLIGFWMGFWVLSSASLLLFSIFFAPLNLGHLAAASLGLLVFTGIWTYLMEVISENPLSFDHLMPEAQDSDRAKDWEYVSSALIKRRRD